MGHCCKSTCDNSAVRIKYNVGDHYYYTTPNGSFFEQFRQRIFSSAISLIESILYLMETNSYKHFG